VNHAHPVFSYQLSHRFFAQLADGLQDLARAELEELGAQDVKAAYRGAYFNADERALYEINYRARFITRVLAPLIDFDCHSARYLYKTLRKLDWEEVLPLDASFAVTANLSQSRINHSQYASRVVKDAAVDYWRDRSGRRPRVDPKSPDLWLHLHLHRNHATLSVDCSGGSLHRRGYRKRSVEAPMMETLAAAIIELSGWEGDRPLLDPMCGSGTLLSEALMKVCRIPAGYLRERFGLENLPDYQPKLFERVQEEAKAGIRELSRGLLLGNDLSAQNLEVAKENCRLLPQGDKIIFRQGDFHELKERKNQILVCNPPYGRRLKGEKEPEQLLGEFGDYLKRNCQGSRALIYVGEKNLLKSVGLRPNWKRALKNGQLDGRLACYEMY